MAFTTPWSDQAEENTLPIGVDTAFMVSAQTKHPDEVMKFMEHLTSAEGVRQWYEKCKSALRLYQWKQRIWIQSLWHRNAIIESGKVVSKDSYHYFSGEYKSKFESDLQLFAATPKSGQKD